MINNNVQSTIDWNLLVWSGLAPPKMEVCMWLVIRKKILVRAELAHRGMSSIQNALCPLCGTSVETVNHLLFTCMVSWKLWTRCAALWGISLVLHNELGHFLRHGMTLSLLVVIWIFLNYFFFVRLRAAMWFKAKNPASVPYADSLVLDPSFLDKSRPSKAIDLSISVWSAPPVVFLKMNVDGAMLRDASKWGIRGVLKDNVGERLAYFSLALGSGPPILAELEVICHGNAMSGSRQTLSFCALFRDHVIWKRMPSLNKELGKGVLVLVLDLHVSVWNWN
ncbi:hypothetical protein V6N12_068374 [Hibiscus sabdariffa]|uniref:Reverse transcriptase zinc-binding domain-containing protein n=1 Tax=Hibiscus sabdariffa TaxID=183260 RepID=A0ABR2FPR9_9ROSI